MRKRAPAGERLEPLRTEAIYIMEQVLELPLDCVLNCRVANLFLWIRGEAVSLSGKSNVIGRWWSGREKVDREHKT